MIERIRTARTAIDATGADVMLIARAEILLKDASRVSEAIDKLEAFAEAGADVLYAPGVSKDEDIRTMVLAVAPRPVNLLVMNPRLGVAEIADLGHAGSASAAAWRAPPGAVSSVWPRP